MFIFPFGDLEYTPFSYASSELEENDIRITEKYCKADVFVAKFIPRKNIIRGLKWKLKFGSRCPLLVWSAEPRDYPETSPIFDSDGFYPEIHVMNMYTDGVYRAPGSYYGFHIHAETPLMTEEELSGKTKFSVAIMKFTAQPKPFVIKGLNVDLQLTRQSIALVGNSIGLVDIHGLGWSEGTSIGGTGCKGDWVNDKIQILQNYKFNICLENTAYPLYITEKIWQAIEGRCLPIYSSFNSSIYELFPENSFIDAAKFENVNELFVFLKLMEPDEYLKRFNLCVESMNRFYKEYSLSIEREWIAQQLVKRLKEIYIRKA